MLLHLVEVNQPSDNARNQGQGAAGHVGGATGDGGLLRSGRLRRSGSRLGAVGGSGVIRSAGGLGTVGHGRVSVGLGDDVHGRVTTVGGRRFVVRRLGGRSSLSGRGRGLGRRVGLGFMLLRSRRLENKERGVVDLARLIVDDLDGVVVTLGERLGGRPGEGSGVGEVGNDAINNSEVVGWTLAEHQSDGALSSSRPCDGTRFSDDHRRCSIRLVDWVLSGDNDGSKTGNSGKGSSEETHL